MARLCSGEFHALIDLAVALEREDDPRGPVVDRLIRGAMERLLPYKSRTSFGPAAVAEWQRLTVAVLRVMVNPNMDALATAAEQLLGRQETR